MNCAGRVGKYMIWHTNTIPSANDMHQRISAPLLPGAVEERDQETSAATFPLCSCTGTAFQDPNPSCSWFALLLSGRRRDLHSIATPAAPHMPGSSFLSTSRREDENSHENLRLLYQERTAGEETPKLEDGANDQKNTSLLKNNSATFAAYTTMRSTRFTAEHTHARTHTYIDPHTGGQREYCRCAFATTVCSCTFNHVWK